MGEKCKDCQRDRESCQFCIRFWGDDNFAYNDLFEPRPEVEKQ